MKNKTALVLSGGGSRGAYEIGVWKALKELRIKIDMVMGTSVGAINSAMIAQGDLKLCEKLWKQLETEMVFDVAEAQQPPKEQSPEANSQKKSHKRTQISQEKTAQIKETTDGKKLSTELQQIQQSLKEKLATIDIGGMPAEDALIYAKEIVTSGGAGSSGLRNLLENYIDEKKVRKSKMQYGLVTTEYPSLEGHFLYLDDIPQGKLIEYILASASCFPAVQKSIIDDKQFIDGGYRDNLPVEMAMKKGAASIIAVDLQAAGFVRKDTIEAAKSNAEEFHLIRSSLDLGNFLIFDKENSSRIMTLGYLDVMREFGRYDGAAYTFKKGQFSPHELLGAESAAYVLGLDPTRIYNIKTLFAALDDSITAYQGSSGYGTYSLNTALKIKEIVAQISHDLSDGDLRISILCYIAESLKRDEANSIFLKSSLFKLLENDIQAANFLLKNGLL